MTDRVAITIDAGVAQVELARPDKLNALDKRMFDGLIAAGEQLSKDKSVRCVVLSGQGRAFCAGLDLQNFMMLAGETDLKKLLLDRHPGSPANYGQQAAYTWSALPVPVIAALHGHVYGGGLQLALGADIRIAAADAELSVLEIKWGLIPDMGGNQPLVNLVSLDVAKELTFTGRKLSGREAAELGLVTRLADDPKAAALETARTIAGKSPHAIRAAKQVLDKCVEVDRAAVLELESQLQLPLIGSPNQLEAVQANFQKREPRFSDPD